jgi:hypothetical protein
VPQQAGVRAARLLQGVGQHRQLSGATAAFHRPAQPWHRPAVPPQPAGVDLHGRAEANPDPANAQDVPGQERLLGIPADREAVAGRPAAAVKVPHPGPLRGDPDLAVAAAEDLQEARQALEQAKRQMWPAPPEAAPGDVVRLGDVKRRLENRTVVLVEGSFRTGDGFFGALALNRDDGTLLHLGIPAVGDGRAAQGDDAPA